MILNFNELASKDIYKVMSNSVFPRPIAWIVTQDEGVVNVAPFSYFIPLASTPPVFVVSIGKKTDGSPKDTLANLIKNKKATICLPHFECIQGVTDTATSLPHDVSEATEYGLELENIQENFPPMIKGIKCAYFVTFRETHTLGKDSPTTPVFMNVESVYFENECIDKDLHVKLDNLGRVGHEYIKDYKRVK